MIYWVCLFRSLHVSTQALPLSRRELVRDNSEKFKKLVTAGDVARVGERCTSYSQHEKREKFDF